MSDPRCTTYNCGRSMVTRIKGKPYCQQCVTSYYRGLARAANEVLDHLRVFQKEIIGIGLGGDE